MNATNEIPYTDTALPELAYLITVNDGRSRLLGAATGFPDYLANEVVLDGGRQVYEARLAAVAGTDEEAVVARYFATAGRLMAVSTTSFSAASTAFPTASFSYLCASQGTAEVAVIDGRTVLTLHDRTPTITQLLERHVAEPDDVTMFGRFVPDADPQYISISRGALATSADATHWSYAGVVPEDLTGFLESFADHGLTT